MVDWLTSVATIRTDFYLAKQGEFCHLWWGKQHFKSESGSLAILILHRGSRSQKYLKDTKGSKIKIKNTSDSVHSYHQFIQIAWFLEHIIDSVTIFLQQLLFSKINMTCCMGQPDIFQYMHEVMFIRSLKRKWCLTLLVLRPTQLICA
ncbi:hypothetical protein AMTRI_Chr11g152380 [Amborella trichopoda]